MVDLHGRMNSCRLVILKKLKKIENYFTYIDVLKRERRNTLRIEIMKKS